MKTPKIAFLNSLGFANVNQKIAYAAWVLSGLVYPNPKKIVLTKAGRNQPEISVPAVKSNGEFSTLASAYIDTGIEQFKGSILLPIASAMYAINAPFSDDFVMEITPNVTIDDWLGNLASNTPETLVQTDEPDTLERYLYKYAALSPNCTITEDETTVIDVKTGKNMQVPCKILDIHLPLDAAYDFGDTQLQLDKIIIAGD
jgi:hypothetical protein